MVISTSPRNSPNTPKSEYSNTSPRTMLVRPIWHACQQRPLFVDFTLTIKVVSFLNEKVVSTIECSNK